MSHGLSVSFVSGVGRPTIWLPEEALETWTSTDLRNVLIHEMMHLRHHDIAANWFLVMVRAIHWFNPLVHLTFRNFVTDR